MKINIVGTNISENRGDGIRLGSDIELNINNANIERNGGHGINVTQYTALMKQFGLPENTDPKQLADLIAEIQNAAPGSDKQKIIRNHNLFSKLFPGAVNVSTLISNLINIASSPQMVSVITSLIK